jgi:transcriptional regulator with XRE-family HTH domain
MLQDCHFHVKVPVAFVILGFNRPARRKHQQPDEASLWTPDDLAVPVLPVARNQEDMTKVPSRPRANDADHFVGARIRERRILLGLSQQQLADLIGVTYQQAHKYERGINRISAGRLHQTAQVLGVPVGYFFEGLEQQNEQELSDRQRMCLELARNFSNIANERHQEALSQLARALANEAHGK